MGFIKTLLGLFAISSVLTIHEPAIAFPQEKRGYFGIHVVDQETGRGVPLVRLRSTNSVDYWTDSGGWVAVDDPDLMHNEVHFAIDSAGYEYPADGFGFRGTVLTPVPGKLATIQIKRNNLAERLYRVTGQGTFRDSELLGQTVPTGAASNKALVTGQDSVQMVPFHNEFFWLWGDTNVPRFPLGNFHTTTGTSPKVVDKHTDPDLPIALTYRTDRDGRLRKMLPIPQPGAVWLFGLINIPNTDGEECLVAHFSRHLKLGQMVEHGIAVWNESLQQFEIKTTLKMDNHWRHPRGQAVRVSDQTGDFVYFCEPFATTRVPANLVAMLNPDSYEAYAWDPTAGKYLWQKRSQPTTQQYESQLLTDQAIPQSQAIYQLSNSEDDKPVIIHRASINWNEYRQRWILIGCELGGSKSPSALGEIWYAEATSVTGPWQKAIKIASHPQYSFYNPRHHQPFDKDGGRIIYFEGTYTHQFSGSEQQTPRYDYNQIMYRLDLGKLPASFVK